MQTIYAVNKPSTVIDLDTGRKVATISPDKPSFPVELLEDRARVFRVSLAEGVE